MIIGITLGIGGLVLMGSSKASTDRLELLLKQSEEERSAAIDAQELIQFGRTNPTSFYTDPNHTVPCFSHQFTLQVESLQT